MDSGQFLITAYHMLTVKMNSGLKLNKTSPKSLIFLARPERFERPTLRFVV